MQYFDFTLRFDDENHSLTSKNGLPVEKLAELLLSLAKAVNSDDKNPLTLSEIRGNCYALQVSTPVLTIYETLKVVHTKISNNDFSGLNSEQKKYASKLKVILGNRLTLNVYNPQRDFEVQVSEIILPKQPDFYYEIGSIYGIITSIGGNAVNGKTVVHVNKISYDIEVTSKQESELIQHYKKTALRFLVRKKISADKKEIVSAKLESFDLIGHRNFYTSVSDARQALTSDFYDKLNDEYYNED